VGYLWLKTFHIVGVVAWFAGLFYLVRLFVYHVEAVERPVTERLVLEPQFALMERRLYGIITRPAMLLTLGTAAGMLLLSPGWLAEWWLWAKAALVGGLVLYQVLCGRIMHRLAAGDRRWTAQALRALNEVPTLFLIMIVLLVVFKHRLPPLAAVLVVLGIGVLLAVAIRLYARARKPPEASILGPPVSGA
jgi:protoporphyrinogen IX oxidase